MSSCDPSLFTQAAVEAELVDDALVFQPRQPLPPYFGHIYNVLPFVVRQKHIGLKWLNGVVIFLFGSNHPSCHKG
jgi:hypothetical protein